MPGFEKLFLPEIGGETLAEGFEAVTAGAGPRLQRCAQLDSDGASVPFLFLLSPASIDGRNAVCVQPLEVPIPQHEEPRGDLNLLVKERTAEISELNGFLTAIVDSSTETCIIAIGTNGTILSFNEGACRMFLHIRADVVGRMHASRLFDQAAEEDGTYAALEREARTRGKCQRMVTLRRRDDGVFPALIDLTPLLSADGSLLGTLLIGRDVTETLRTQRALEEKKDQLEFMNHLSLGISQTLELEAICSIALQRLVEKFDGVLGGIFLKNRTDGSLSLVVSEPRALRGRYADMLTPSPDDRVLAEEGEVLLHDLSHMAILTAADGTAHPRSKLILPLLPKASFLGMLVILVKEPLTRSEEFLSFLSALGMTVGGAIENAILYFESLKKSIEIKKQNQELDEFAYVVSHDLKEPLAGISFISNLLMDEYYDTLDDTAKVYINNLKDFSQRLGSLIDSLLELSRIGRMNQPMEAVKIIDVISSVSQSLSFRISTKETQITLPEELPQVHGERTRVEQVFFNLLSNAIKFNDKEKVVVEITWQEFDERFYEFSIRDNGIGIEPQYFEKIFKIFERLHQREEYEGNGAGLTIVKKIVEHHGGRIWLQSELGMGTEFHFTLPKTPQ